MRVNFEFWVSSYRSFMIHIENKSYLKKLASGEFDEWYKKFGWIELRELEKTYPLNKFKLTKYNKAFKGYDYFSSAYCACIEFKAVLK